MSHNLPPMDMSLTRRRLLQGTLGGAAGLVAWHQGWPRLQSAAAQKNTPSGQMTWAIHVTLAPSWLDPSETLALATPYMLLYAVHDAMLKPMPDFLPFYGTMATGVRWIVPKKSIEKIGCDASKTHPVGLGPYRLVTHQPGIEVVLEANMDYWRKPPPVKRLVMKSVPEATTRLA